LEEHSRSKRARLSIVNELQANTETHYSDERKLFGSITEEFEMYTSQTLAQVSSLCNAAIIYSQHHLQTKKYAESTKYHNYTAVGHLDAIKQSTSNLTNNGIKEVSSGNTPRKRKWQYSDEWALTKNRDELLQAWNQYQSSTTTNESKIQDDKQPTVLSGPSGTENIDSNSHHEVKSESSDVDVPLPKPLVDSRKRNHVSTRASSRRVR
jgi:kinesin family member 11